MGLPVGAFLLSLALLSSLVAVLAASCAPLDGGTTGAAPAPAAAAAAGAPAPAPPAAAAASPPPSPRRFGSFSPPLSALPPATNAPSEEAGFFGDGVVVDAEHARWAKFPGEETPLATAVALPTTAGWIDVGAGEHGGTKGAGELLLVGEKQGLVLRQRGVGGHHWAWRQFLSPHSHTEGGKCTATGTISPDFHSPIASSRLSSRSWAQLLEKPSCRLCGAPLN